MWGLQSILSLFYYNFNKLNNAWAQMLDSILYIICHLNYFEIVYLAAKVY